MKVLGIDNVLFAVGDLNEAIAFYHDQLGLTIKFQFAQARIAAFRLGHEEPGLLIRAEATITTPRVWLEVEDARKTLGELESRGIKAIRPAFEVQTGWAFEVADPWGNIVGFTDYVKDPGRARQP